MFIGTQFSILYTFVSVEKGARRPLLPASVVCPPGGCRRRCLAITADDDDPFIVLTETKFRIRYIPVWARYSPLRPRVEARAITLSP